MQFARRQTALVIALALPLAACGGGGTSSSVPNGTSAAVPSVSRTKNGAAFTIRIPKAAQSSSTAAARTSVRNTSLSRAGASARLPQYVSTGTASATIALTSVNGAAPPSGYAAVTTPLTSGGSACATVNSVLQCTVTVPAPPGADTFAITLSDVNAHALSTNSETVTVAAGQTTTAQPLVLNGIAATYAIAPATDAATTVHVSASGGGYRILGMLPYTFSFQPVDASGATIIGPGTPALTVTSASSDVTATAVTGQSGSYTLKVVTQSTAAVSLTVQSTGGATVTVPITTSPEYFVADAGTLILAYDINGTTATLIPSDGLTFTNSVNLGGVAIDAAGHVWTSDENYGLRSYNPGSTTALTSIPVAGSWQLAFAPSGTLYAESYVSPNMYLKGYNASSGALLTTSSVVGGTDAGPLAIDSLGQLWFGDEYNTNTVKGFTSAGTQIGALTISTGNPQNALAFDASGHLWVGQNATMSAYNTSTGAIVAGSTITNGIATPNAILFDPAGDIIELDNYQDTIHVYSPAGALLRTIPLPTNGYMPGMAIAP